MCLAAVDDASARSPVCDDVSERTDEVLAFDIAAQRNAHLKAAAAAAAASLPFAASEGSDREKKDRRLVDVLELKIC